MKTNDADVLALLEAFQQQIGLLGERAARAISSAQFDAAQATLRSAVQEFVETLREEDSHFKESLHSLLEKVLPITQALKNATQGLQTQGLVCTAADYATAWKAFFDAFVPLIQHATSAPSLFEEAQTPGELDQIVQKAVDNAPVEGLLQAACALENACCGSVAPFISVPFEPDFAKASRQFAYAVMQFSQTLRTFVLAAAEVHARENVDVNRLSVFNFNIVCVALADFWAALRNNPPPMAPSLATDETRALLTEALEQLKRTASDVGVLIQASETERLLRQRREFLEATTLDAQGQPIAPQLFQPLYDARGLPQRSSDGPTQVLAAPSSLLAQACAREHDAYGLKIYTFGHP